MVGFRHYRNSFWLYAPRNLITGEMQRDTLLWFRLKPPHLQSERVKLRGNVFPGTVPVGEDR